MDVFSSEKRSEVMSSVRSTGNKTTEVPLARSMRKLGVRGWRRHLRISGLRTKPDFVFQSERVVVFVDGCFWHRCPLHGTSPANNAEFWRKKLDGNVERDRRVDALLAESGWRIVRFWEHSIKSDADACALTVMNIIKELK